MAPPRTTSSRRDSFPGIRLHIRGSDRTAITAEQVGLFLFDFTVAFEVFRRVAEDGALYPSLTKWDLYRGRHRVRPFERLAIESLRMESPIELVATTVAITAAGAGAIWAAVQTLERIYMFPLNRRKAELEIQKLGLEVEERQQKQLESGTAQLGPSRVADRLVGRLLAGDFRAERYDDSEPERVIRTVERRLLRNPVQVEQLDFAFDPDISPPAA